MAEVNVLLSCGTDDKTLKIERDCTFDEFRFQVKGLFPHLPEHFTISDGDFNELDSGNFHQVKNSRLETWCLVRGSKEEAYKLDKPHSELMRYDVHPNALTQSGNYHFSASYQAFCEFIDNSIQATSTNNCKDMERTIDIHVFLKDKLVAIFDNGEGMTYEGLKAFATYFLSQADRGLEKEEVDLIPAYLDGAISKFGVGATQAGFYLGDRIKVITKRHECPYVTEITISKEKLQERAKEGKPVFEDYRWIRNPSDTTTLQPGEEERCLKDIIEREAAYTQFTMIIITGIRDIHIDSIREDGGSSLARNLAHVYHFYLFGDRGRSGNMKLPALGNSKVPMEFGMSSFLKVDLRLVIDDGKNSNQKTFFDLREIDDDLESLYQTRAKEWFPFSLTMKVPGLDPHQTVQGVLMYFPHEAGHETLPRPEDLEDDGQEPIFECFWQGRLAPLSYVHKMEFCTSPAQRSKRQKDVVPDSCYRRLKGILFFNRHTPVSNNKLKILLDERKDLSSALEDASTERRLPQEFRTWLEKCHRELDKEVSFDTPLPPSQQPRNGDVLHSVLRVTTSSGVQVYKVGDVVKLDTKPIIYGKVLHFVKVSKKNDVDKVVVQRQPDEVYLNQVEERPISRILEIPDQNILKRVFSQEKQMLPKTVKVYKGNLSNEITSRTTLQWSAGETQKDFTGFWVKIFNGERPPKLLVSLHNKKLCVRQVIEGPENMAPIQNDQPHDGEKFGFKPFWLSVAGKYSLKYAAMLGDREMASTQFDIIVNANIASFFTLTEPSQKETPELALGEPGLKFKLSFKDSKGNAATVFSSGEFVTLVVTCPNLEVQGLKDKYKPNSDGVLEVSGISLTPNGSGKVQYGRDHTVTVDVTGIDFVKFPVRFKAGQPQSVKLPQFETTEVANYEEFPEFVIQVLDQWSQPCSVSDRRTKLHAECEAFVGGPHLANIEQGQGRFSAVKVKLPPGKAPCTVKVKISLVVVESQNRRKLSVSEVLKELKQFSIKVLPSSLPHKVLICEGNDNGILTTNGVDKNSKEGRDCLELTAPAGSIVKGLFLKVFDESGKLLDEEDFKSAEPKVTTSWSGEVPVRSLPYLPDCPVANLAASTFVGNVECVCNDVKCQSQIRIKPIAGEPQKWLFSSDTATVDIECDSRKQLSQKLKIRVLDKLGNPAECPSGVEPMVSVEHSPSKSGSTAVFIGNLICKGTEFVFNNEATISGHPGIITMNVCDKDGKFSRDTQRISLKPGAPHHIELKSQAFDDSSQKHEHTAKLFSNCFLNAPIHAFVCDRSGNKTPAVRTTLNLSWTPSSCGLLLTKRTQKGEAVFEANAMKCGSRSGDQQIKLRVFSPENKNLTAATVTATLEKSNRVKAVVVQIAADQALVATGCYPLLKVECRTEDGVRVDAVGHLSLEITRPNGTPLSTAVYRKPTQNREGLVTFQSIANRYLEESGQWSIVCQYTEYRDRLKSVLPPTDHVTRSDPVQFVVQPGPAHRLVLRFPSGSPGSITASCTADVKGRTILPRPGKSGVDHVDIAAEDSYGNDANVSLTVSVTIQPSGTVPEGVILPDLENSPVQITLNHGTARLPRLTLCSRVGNYIGEYMLVFSAPDVQSHSIKFAFSTDEHIQRIQSELQPLKKQITDYEQNVSEAKRKLNRSQSEVALAVTPLRSAFRGEPRKRDVVNILQTSRNELNQYETSQATTRPAITQQGHPPARIRQYIKGIVAELAYVSNPLLARILSWYLQSKMQVALTSTTEQQRKVYDAGHSAYCEATLLSFIKRDFDGSDGKVLPLELPAPPPNYRSSIEFAVNLLEFTSDHGYLRCSLFWNLLSKTIVVKDLKSGQAYREHLTRMRQSCPTILTRDGNMIAADGLMDPKRRCPQRMEDLRFAFGALPARETARYRELKEKCDALDRLQVTVDKHEKEMEDVRSREERLNEVRKSLSPRITELERELRKLRPPGMERDNGEPADKRRKR